MAERSSKFETSVGTQGKRNVPNRTTLGLICFFAIGFLVCFGKNIFVDTTVNWVSVGSQFGFAIAFVAMSTFYIRWSNVWFQKHADEEFTLKRLDLDIDRATWIVELAMEWEKITSSPIPPELLQTLSLNLFSSEKPKPIDIHPSETLLSSMLGKSGTLTVEPNKLSLQRSDAKVAK